MFPSYAPRWSVAAMTAGVWALAAAAVVFWGLRLAAPSEAAPPPTVAPAQAMADPAAVARMLGAVQVSAGPIVESGRRFVLWGVIADDAEQGAALIGIDDEPPRPYRVGETVAQGHVLQSVAARSAIIGAEGGALMLQLPERAPGAPRIVSGPGSAPPSAMVLAPPASAPPDEDRVVPPPPPAIPAFQAIEPALGGAPARAR